MYYYQNPQNNSLEGKVRQLQQDKKQLSNAIDQLNTCYQQKIYLLQNTIMQQQSKYQEVLEWKQNHVDKSLFDMERYQLQIKKMIEILDNAHANFQEEKHTLSKQISDQQQVIRELREENEALSQFNSQNQFKIEQMVMTYTDQIEKLKQDLRDLREQSVHSQNSSMVALRDITSSHDSENISPNLKQSGIIKSGDPAFSKMSITTMME